MTKDPPGPGSSSGGAQEVTGLLMSTMSIFKWVMQYACKLRQ